jgi:Tfp pilus assembly protein PilV
MPKSRLHSQAGFTLIEVGMAALILVAGFISLIQAITIGSQMLDNARKQQIAMQIVEGEVEWLRAQSDSFIPNTLASDTISVSSAGVATVTNSAGNFHLEDNPALLELAKGFTVRMVKTNIRTNFDKVVYTVTWTGASGRDYYRRVDTDSDGTVDASNRRTFEFYFEKNGLRLSFQKS